MKYLKLSLGFLFAFAGFLCYVNGAYAGEIWDLHDTGTFGFHYQTAYWAGSGDSINEAGNSGTIWAYAACPLAGGNTTSSITGESFLSDAVALDSVAWVGSSGNTLDSATYGDYYNGLAGTPFHNSNGVIVMPITDKPTTPDYPYFQGVGMPFGSNSYSDMSSNCGNYLIISSDPNDTLFGSARASTISFTYPTSTTMPVGNITWQLDYENVTSTDTYTVNVDSTDGSREFVDYGGDFLGVGDSYGFLSTHTVGEYDTTSTWTSTASLIDQSDSGTVVATSSVTYTVPPVSSATVGCADLQNISITYPSGTIANDFGTWTASTTPLDEGCTYGINIAWYSTYQGPIYSHTDAIATTIGIESVNNLFLINKTIPAENLWTGYGGTTTTYNYLATIIDQTAGDVYQGAIVGQTSGSFQLAVSTSSAATLPAGASTTQPCGGVGTCSTGNTTIFFPTSTLASSSEALANVCVPPAGLLDIGGGIAYGFCSTINYLFVPSAATGDIMQDDMNKLENIPPFSWFFQLNGAVGAVANGGNSYLTPNGSAVYTVYPNASTSLSGATAAPDNGLAFTIQNGIDGSTSTMTLLPSDLTTNSFLSTKKGKALVDDYYNFILTAALLVIIIMMYKIIL